MNPIIPETTDPMIVHIRDEIKKAKKLKVTGKVKRRKLTHIAYANLIVYGGNLEIVAIGLKTNKNKYIKIAGTFLGWVGKGLKLWAKHIKVKTKGF